MNESTISRETKVNRTHGKHNNLHICRFANNIWVYLLRASVIAQLILYGNEFHPPLHRTLLSIIETGRLQTLSPSACVRDMRSCRLHTTRAQRIDYARCLSWKTTDRLLRRWSWKGAVETYHATNKHQPPRSYLTGITDQPHMCMSRSSYIVAGSFVAHHNVAYPSRTIAYRPMA